MRSRLLCLLGGLRQLREIVDVRGVFINHHGLVAKQGLVGSSGSGLGVGVDRTLV